MALPPIPVAMLASFVSRPIEEFSAWAPEAIRQATFFLSLRTRIKDQPLDPDLAELVRLARLDLAYRLYLDRQFYEVKSNPFQSETIGSYSYSKSNLAQKALTANETGIPWFDILLRYLESLNAAQRIESDGITVFEYDDMYQIGSGRRYIAAPLSMDEYYGFVNSEVVIHDPNVRY